MKIPSKEELKEFLNLNMEYWVIGPDTGFIAEELHDYLMNYNSNEEPSDG